MHLSAKQRSTACLAAIGGVAATIGTLHFSGAFSSDRSALVVRLNGEPTDTQLPAGLGALKNTPQAAAIKKSLIEALGKDEGTQAIRRFDSEPIIGLYYEEFEALLSDQNAIENIYGRRCFVFGHLKHVGSAYKSDDGKNVNTWHIYALHKDAHAAAQNATAVPVISFTDKHKAAESFIFGVIHPSIQTPTPIEIWELAVAPL